MKRKQKSLKDLSKSTQKNKKFCFKNKLIFLVLLLFICLTAFLVYEKVVPAKNNISEKALRGRYLYIEDPVVSIFNEIINKEDSNKIDSYNLSAQGAGAEIVISSEDYKKYLEDFKTINSFSQVYVPIISWQNYSIDNLDLENLKYDVLDNKVSIDGKDLNFVYFCPYNQDYIKILGEELKFTCTDFSKLSEYKNSKNFISFISINDLTPDFKALNINGKNPFNGNLNDYELKVYYYLQTRVGTNDTTDKLNSYVEKYKNSIDDITKITSVGDIMLSRDVGIKIRKSKDNALPFRNFSDYLSSSDITFGNLESPFYDKGLPKDIGMSFKAEPYYMDGLVLSGFDVLSLANNHFGNQGREGMKYTFNYLNKNNIKYCGAGYDYEEAHSAAQIKSKNNNYSFLSYNMISPESYSAGENTPGLAFISSNESQVSKMESDIIAEKEKGNFIFVSFHWGSEYTPKASTMQRDIAKRAIIAGADIIVAQHPHVVQGIEFINKKPIIYSLGNFVFDQMWSQETREGAILDSYVFRNKVISFDIIPTIIENYNQPRLANSTEKYDILSRIIGNSYF